jgi:phosphoribosylanthranilate isomerase
MFVKICGITRASDAEAAVSCGASAIGFIFWPKSPRYIEPARARDIARRLPPFVVPVGVFVNEAVEQVNRVAEQVGLGAVQLHGDEDLSVLDRLNRPAVKAIGGPGMAAAPAWPSNVMLLVDADDREQRGGTGRRADWEQAARLAAERRILLAGGISAANAAEAIRVVRPFGIDVSSGVEQAPGIKDPGRIRALFDAIRMSSAGEMGLR